MENIDRDGSEGLSVEEMVEWMVRLERAETMRGLRTNFKETDRNGNGHVTLTEFAHTVASFGECVCCVCVCVCVIFEAV